MNAIQVKAVRVKVIAQSLFVYYLTAIGFVCIIELYIYYGEGVGIIVFVHKGKLFAADTSICLFKLYRVKRIIQCVFEQPKIGVRFVFGHFVSDFDAVFLFVLV